MLSAVAVANYFISRALTENTVDVNASKLHELSYLAQGWHIGQTGKPLLRSAVSAARDGVLVPELKEQGCWGTRRIETLISVYEPDPAGAMQAHTPQLGPADPALPTLAWIWDTFGALSPFELNRLTRETGAPWDKVWHHASRTREEAYDIPFEVLKKWFFAEVHLHRARANRDAGLSDTGKLRTSDAREITQRFVPPPESDDLRPL